MCGSFVPSHRVLSYPSNVPLGSLAGSSDESVPFILAAYRE